MVEALLGTVIGGVIGYLIGTQFSKLGGGCPILCNPKISTVYFAIIGFLFGSGY